MKYKDESKIEALTKATVELVFQSGLAGITMSKVAKQAKIATGTVYIYFKSKDELLTHVFMAVKKRSLEVVIEDIDFTKPFLPTMKRLWLNFFHYSLKNQKESVFVEQFKYSPFIQRLDMKDIEEFERPISSFLEVGKQELLIKNEENSLLYGSILGITREMAKLIYEHTIELNETTEDRMFKMVWDSIKN
ncbi:MAG: TetR/AcrR family transcriptional regulator [Bacteroidota bacterium]